MIILQNFKESKMASTFRLGGLAARPPELGFMIGG
jgi:hypothetical protein